MKPEHKICSKLTDPEIVRKMMEQEKLDFFCPSRVPMDLADTRARLNDKGYHVMMTNSIRIQAELSQCQTCSNYIGNYDETKICFKLKERDET